MPWAHLHSPAPTGKLSPVLEVCLCVCKSACKMCNGFFCVPTIMHRNIGLCISFLFFPLSTTFLRFTHGAMYTVPDCCVVKTVGCVSTRGALMLCTLPACRSFPLYSFLNSSTLTAHEGAPCGLPACGITASAVPSKHDSSSLNPLF